MSCNRMQHQDRLSRPCIEIVEISFFDLSKYSWIRCGHSEGNFWNTHQGFFSTSSCLLSHFSLGSDGGLSYGCTWTCGEFYGSLRRGEVDGRQSVRNFWWLHSHIFNLWTLWPINLLTSFHSVEILPRNSSGQYLSHQSSSFSFDIPIVCSRTCLKSAPENAQDDDLRSARRPSSLPGGLGGLESQGAKYAFVFRFVCWEWTWGVSEWCFFLAADKFSSLGGSGLGYFKDRVEMGLSFQCDFWKTSLFMTFSPLFSVVLWSPKKVDAILMAMCRTDWKIWRRPSSSWLNWPQWCEECGVLFREVENSRPELRNRAYTEVPVLPPFFSPIFWEIGNFYWGETTDLNRVGTLIRMWY